MNLAAWRRRRALRELTPMLEPGERLFSFAQCYIAFPGERRRTALRWIANVAGSFVPGAGPNYILEQIYLFVLTDRRVLVTAPRPYGWGTEWEVILDADSGPLAMVAARSLVGQRYHLITSVGSKTLMTCRFVLMRSRTHHSLATALGPAEP